MRYFSWWIRSIYNGVPCSRLSIGIWVAALALLVATSAPILFPAGEVVVIDPGMTLQEVAETLEEERVVRFSGALQALVALLGRGGRIQAGEYVFAERAGLFQVAWRITTGAYGLEALRVRLPEGSTRDEIGNILAQHLGAFDKGTFMRVTDGKEGYLFPDTYFLLPNTSAERVADILAQTFVSKTEGLRQEVASSGVSFEDIVILASIIEREAHDARDRRLISSVLWNRLAIDMPLQVDAPFVFLLGKGSRELTKEDLAIDSPYNTYTNRGLPPGPIANPGLDALDAALNPAETKYLYYLSDRNGTTYFAEDFDGHQRNRELYLR